MEIKEKWKEQKIRESEERIRKKMWFRFFSIGLKKVLDGEETGEKAIDRIEKQMILIAIGMITLFAAPFVMFVMSVANCSFVLLFMFTMTVIAIGFIFSNFYLLRIQLWRMVMIENDNFGQETTWLAGTLVNRFFRYLFRENRR